MRLSSTLLDMADVERYRALIGDAERKDVPFGYGGVTLFSAAELEHAQTGYSVAPDGTSLCGNGAGDWKKSWLVIGQDQLLDDPIFIDIDQEAMPVFTAEPGEGAWNAVSVCSSVIVFRGVVEEFAALAEGRESPDAYEDNPLTKKQRSGFIERAVAVSDAAGAREFWEGQTEVEDED